MTEKEKRIGILGGSFNPPHLAHLICAEHVQETLQLDKVYFMPSAIPPHKNGKTTIASHHREQMVNLAIQDNPLFAIETYEMDKGGVNYTYDTMLHLKTKYPDSHIYFIIGADMIENLPTWYRVDDLVKSVTIVGVNRTGYATQSVYPIQLVTVPFIEMSSSAIRLRVKQEKSIRYLVPQAVMHYIEQKGLYQDVSVTFEEKGVQ